MRILFVNELDKHPVISSIHKTEQNYNWIWCCDSHKVRSTCNLCSYKNSWFKRKFWRSAIEYWTGYQSQNTVVLRCLACSWRD